MTNMNYPCNVVGNFKELFQKQICKFMKSRPSVSHLSSESNSDYFFAGSIVRGAFTVEQGFSEEVVSLAEKLVPLTRCLWHLTKVTDGSVKNSKYHMFKI